MIRRAIRCSFFLFVGALLLLNSNANAQPPIKDAWLWTTLSLDKKLNKKFTLNFDQELRLFDNMSRVNLFFSTVTLDYKLSKAFKFSLAYRFINKNQFDYYSKRHRMYFDAAFKQKIKKNFLFTYRVRLQGQVRDYYSSDNGRMIESYIRNKFDLGYSYKKFTPYVSAEFRYQLTNPRFQVGDSEFNRGRYTGGCEYDFDKKNTLNLYFMLQHDYQTLNYEEDFVYGMQFSHSF